MLAYEYVRAVLVGMQIPFCGVSVWLQLVKVVIDLSILVCEVRVVFVELRL